ncbi:DDE-type integrase/transposase/recombinase, partial [Listeria cornellensis]
MKNGVQMSRNSKLVTGRKKYLSAIIDLYDRSIVAYILSSKNDNKLVMDTIKLAMKRNPKVKPMIHSDRGFQYTSHAYRDLKNKFGFKVSMSRVAKCLDNQPIESFLGHTESRILLSSFLCIRKGVNPR